MSNFIELTDNKDTYLVNLNSISRLFQDESLLADGEKTCRVIFIGEDSIITLNGINYEELKAKIRSEQL